jgi:galactofuranose transport system substrate-binding protein
MNKLPARPRAAHLLPIALCAAVLVSAGTSSCGNRQKSAAPSAAARPLRIGFSQMENNNPWRIAETNSIRGEAEKRGYELTYVEARSSSAQQVTDVKYLIAQKVDYIILAPREFEPLAPALQAAREAAVPLILIDRAARGEPGVDYLTLIASDFIEEGKRAGRWLANASGGTANIVELQGTLGASPTTDRKKGFESVINKYPGMRIIGSETGDYFRTLGQKAMESMIKAKGRSITAVFSHNDEMAIGAIQALKAAGIAPNKDVVIVSIDGERDALKAIIAGELGATIECNPRFGPKAFDVIEAHRRGEAIPASIIIPDLFFDKNNAIQYIDKVY